MMKGSELNLSGWIKKLTGKTTITVGSVGLEGVISWISLLLGKRANGKVNKMGDLIEKLEREEFDLIAVGRALLADPDWVNKIRDGRTEVY
jgi:2,4-dienoyl-CoA reductase-like NADH-dependent reductase (Old Yellow Enzyme family)